MTPFYLVARPERLIPRYARHPAGTFGVCRRASRSSVRTQPCGLHSSNSSDLKKKKGPGGDPLSLVARPERFELPTTWFEARDSIQLSYGRYVYSMFVLSSMRLAFSLNLAYLLKVSLLQPIPPFLSSPADWESYGRYVYSMFVLSSMRLAFSHNLAYLLKVSLLQPIPPFLSSPADWESYGRVVSRFSLSTFQTPMIESKAASIVPGNVEKGGLVHSCPFCSGMTVFDDSKG